MKILVTGAGGFLGSRAVSTWGLDSDLTAVVRDRSADAVPAGVKALATDLAGPVDHRELPEQVDAVVYFAQSRRYREFPGGATDMEAVNVGAALSLADYAISAGAKNFVYLSTGGVYRPSDRALKETQELDPSSFYAASKAAAEALLEHYSDLLNVVILRPFFVYGPGQSGMLMPTLIDKVTRGREIVVDDENGMRSNPTYVDDAVEMVRRALELPLSTTLNVAGDQTLSIREMAEIIGRVVGREASVVSQPCDRPIDLIPDLTACHRELGNGAGTDFLRGITLTCEAMGLSVVPER